MRVRGWVTGKEGVEREKKVRGSMEGGLEGLEHLQGDFTLRANQKINPRSKVRVTTGIYGDGVTGTKI